MKAQKTESETRRALNICDNHYNSTTENMVHTYEHHNLKLLTSLYCTACARRWRQFAINTANKKQQQYKPIFSFVGDNELKHIE